MNFRKTIATLGTLAIVGSTALLSVPPAQANEYNNGSYDVRYQSVTSSYNDSFNRHRDNNQERQGFRNAIARHYQRALAELQRIRDDERLTNAVRNQLINRYEGILNYLNNVKNNSSYNWNI